ncbi:YcaO-related McrA-glycine thioamidation protein [Methanobrevibacter filiformis]|uniref:YcaO-like family protein n=1 Tax=Methanobrevibacter filiformis TaxID=55758 RepID=A0A166A9Y2_9EURY|nr:YcaO-related McrA-glycine thioamidation protein [Methanobrevibacter filiformis]KZX11766.1 YcaO-like family protein [Methanobrevibacter filiformis]
MFSDIPIKYFDCTHRAISPKDTLKNFEGKRKIAGITRIGEITHLDRVGVPVYTAIRPTAKEGGVSVYAGKGATTEQAKASALMEGFERYSSEQQEEDKEKYNIKIANLNELSNTINPKDLIIPKNNFKEDKPLEWIISKDITSGESFYIPNNTVFHPYDPIYQNQQLFKSNTNGLASGNVLEESVLHGIFEVVERDAWSIFELNKNIGTEILKETIENEIIQNIISKFENEKIAIKLINITVDTDIPTIIAVADDTISKDPALLTLGVGTHLNPEIAILRALTEVAQSRVTQIHGTREDTVRADFMRKAGYERMKRMNKHYFKDYENKIAIENIQNYSSNSLKKDIETAIKKLENAGLNKVLFVDLTRKEIEVPVVRVVIPKAEIYSVDPERIGMRALNYKATPK